MATYTGDNSTNLITGGNEDDTILGLGGDDQLNGAGGNDTIDGGSGNDLITGGPGIDTLTGGTGADTFRDTAANLNGDTITDFLPGDRIQIVDLTPQNANIGISGSSITFTGGSVTIGNGLGPGRLVVRALGTTGTEVRLQAAAHNDFNGDGRSDVLWRNDNGSVIDWLGQSNGGFVGNGANFKVNPGVDWHVAGTGDFNGDGRVDVLWRNDDGRVIDWLGQSNGSFVGNGPNSSVNPGLDWHIVGTGDFNGDGRDDILWRNDNGTVTDLLGQPSGGFAGNVANLNVNPGLDWHVAGTGDFNGDGICDVLWRNDDGRVIDWLGQPNGSFVGNGPNSSVNPGLDWHVVATGDFNGDGFDDILWRNDSGTVTDLLGQPSGGFAGNVANLNVNPGTDWHVVGIGDYNGDAIDDVLWRNNDGHVIDWLGQTNGGFVNNSANFNVNPGTDWHVQDSFVHDPLV